MYMYVCTATATRCSSITCTLTPRRLHTCIVCQWWRLSGCNRLHKHKNIYIYIYISCIHLYEELLLVSGLKRWGSEKNTSRSDVIPIVGDDSFALVGILVVTIPVKPWRLAAHACNIYTHIYS